MMKLLMRRSPIERVWPGPRQRGGIRSGFALVEVLVVISILLLLIGLLLPAVQSARESARRLQCGNNLRQIGLGIQGYAGVHGVYPLGAPAARDDRAPTLADRSYLVSILPFVEQASLFAALNQSVTILGPENLTSLNVVVATYACPADPAAGVSELDQNGAKGLYGAIPTGARFASYSASYRACVGSFTQNNVQPVRDRDKSAPFFAGRRAQANGCFNEFYPITEAAVTDGLSNTCLVVESARTPLHELDALYPEIYPSVGWWFVGGSYHSLASTFYPPNAWRKLDLDALDARLDSASSLHPGGVQCLLGDGSVHFVKDSIASWPADQRTGAPIGAVPTLSGAWLSPPRPAVWQALATRAGGEFLTDNEY